MQIYGTAVAGRWMEADGPAAHAPTAAQRAADAIVDAIADGHLRGGERLTETVLANRLAISRVPLREALRILESQGLVVPAARRGVQLIAFDQVWAQQIHDARVGIELPASRSAAARIRADPAARRQLDEALAVLTEACAGTRGEAVHKADIALHDVVYALSGAPVLATLWRALARHVLILFSFETYRRRDHAAILQEHRRLVSVLSAGDAAEVDAEVQHHVAGLKYARGEEGPIPSPGVATPR